MTVAQCTHRNHTIIAAVEEHPGIPTPWEGGCRITDPEGQTTRRLGLPLKAKFLPELDSAQHASLAHGRWLVDQHLDHGMQWH